MTDPDPGGLRELHEALLAGDDPTVPARMAEILLPALRRRFARVRIPDPDAVDSLIGLCIARYLREPWRYEPARAPLLAYLWQDISGDVKNEQQGGVRLRQHESPSDAVFELGAPDRNLNVEEEVLDAMDPFDVPPAVLARARGELSRLSEQDRQLIALLGAGVRTTGPYAEVLGIAHLPVSAQARAVKRNKDRLKKRLEVIRGRLS